jgi:hypothetical protein
MAINDQVLISDIVAPPGVALLDDPEETVATLTPPRLAAELAEIEAETEVVGEGGSEGQAGG